MAVTIQENNLHVFKYKKSILDSLKYVSHIIHNENKRVLYTEQYHVFPYLLLHVFITLALKFIQKLSTMYILNLLYTIFLFFLSAYINTVQKKI
jgi:hypothetical protein